MDITTLVSRYVGISLHLLHEITQEYENIVPWYNLGTIGKYIHSFI